MVLSAVWLLQQRKIDNTPSADPEDLAELIKAVRQQLWNESNNCDAGTTGELNEEPLEHVHVELDEDFDG
ncbi:hypothetical protein HUJ04_001437 [Dendroctonus ponderosae]|nr:hypothetical protein HUJ04_001437 [Dendroctonus ponderosae]